MLTPLFPAALSQHFHARTGVNEWIEELTPIDPLKFTFKSITHAQIRIFCTLRAEDLYKPSTTVRDWAEPNRINLAVSGHRETVHRM